MKTLNLIISVSLLLFACGQEPVKQEVSEISAAENEEITRTTYITVKLTTDLTMLTESEKKVIPKLIEAAKIMDELFWQESFGDKEEFLKNLNEEDRVFAEINYGPWDRLNDNQAFLEGYGEKPLGATYYPEDMTAEEFEAWDNEAKKGLYTLVQRGEDGSLKTVAYYEAFAEQVRQASDLLREAAEISEDPEFKNYLSLRAEALLSDDYTQSDIAWLNMKNNTLDCIIGPIENYEDKIYGYKTAHEAYVLVKDKSWSKKLEKYSAMLPDLQMNLPVDDEYKQETPGRDAQLNAYDVIYYAGDCNAGSKTIAVNLPNDEDLQLNYGTRRSQLKNAMKAKYDQILVPISKELVNPDQQQYISFDAFFNNTMFHEVAHGLGIKNTINGKGKVRESLTDLASSYEEGKADVLGLFMITQLHAKGEFTDQQLKESMVTFMTSIFRSVRFGAASAHGKANMLRFNYFMEKGAFSKNAEGKYTVDFDKMTVAMNDLSRLILEIQGDGDYDRAQRIVEEMGGIGEELSKDLEAVNAAGIPVDIVFEQGVEVLGL